MKVRELRRDLIGEEFVELLNGLGLYAAFDYSDTEPCPSWESLPEVADAIGDLLVVVLGTAVACGINIEPIFNEVMRSNMTKFIDGHKGSNGKWIKGPSYSPANLEPILCAQSATKTSQS